MNHKYDKIYNMTLLAKKMAKNYITTSLENIPHLVSKGTATKQNYHRIDFQDANQNVRL